jgi:hypothetical protein
MATKNNTTFSGNNIAAKNYFFLVVIFVKAAKNSLVAENISGLFSAVSF